MIPIRGSVREPPVCPYKWMEERIRISIRIRIMIFPKYKTVHVLTDYQSVWPQANSAIGASSELAGM